MFFFNPIGMAIMLGGVLVLALGAALCLLMAVAFLSNRQSPRTLEPPKTGITIVHGIPGSGKSYFAIWLLLEQIIKERRPVYTNLPLRVKVFRAYLAVRMMNPRAAGYINLLTEKHTKNYTARFAAWEEAREKGGTDEDFQKEFGPHIETGPDANWLPFGSVVAIDEAHKWFASSRSAASDDPALVAAVTMHRHMWHRLILLTQDPAQIGVIFRRNCDTYWKCTNIGRMPIFAFVKVPINAFRWIEYPKEALDGNPQFAKPISAKFHCPALSSGFIFRLYSSHTHGGTTRQMMKHIDATREKVEGKKQERVPWQKIKQRRSRRLIIGGIVALMIFLLGVKFIYTGGKKAAEPWDPTASFATTDEPKKGKKGEPVKVAATQPSRQSSDDSRDPRNRHSSDKHQDKAPEPAPAALPARLAGTTPTTALIGGEILYENDTYRGAKFKGSDTSGVSHWQIGSDMALRWRPGQCPRIYRLLPDGTLGPRMDPREHGTARELSGLEPDDLDFWITTLREPPRPNSNASAGLLAPRSVATADRPGRPSDPRPGAR